jgi:hypothetical protein
MISPMQRPLPDNTQHSQETDIHTPSEIRINNPNKRAAADPHVRPRGHWDRQGQEMVDINRPTGKRVYKVRLTQRSVVRKLAVYQERFVGVNQETRKLERASMRRRN